MKIENLCKSYGETLVFDNWSYEFKDGECYCLMGSSGQGKTTFLRILAGLETADSGTVEGGKLQRTTMVFQENRLCERETAITNIEMVVHGKRESRKSEKEKIMQHLRQVGIEEFQKPVSQFSGGMKRRVAIVRALYPNSDLVLMDEPFTGLDEKTKGKVMEYVLRKLQNRTLIFSTHSEEEAKRLGGNVIKI